jgi:hypothetical protein
LTLIQSRLIDTMGRLHDAPDEITYQHSILCQTGLPYRDPGAGARAWDRKQGNAALRISAGDAMNPETGEWEQIGLPWGPKARLVLLHLNSEAIRTRNARVDVGESLTAFVKRLGLHAHGRDIKRIKDQVGALSAATIRMAFMGPDGSYQLNSQVVEGFDLWFPKDARQRVLWPSYVDLSPSYFESLTRHAVPLDERAIAALSHSAMCLDVYAWLAQRLHRIPRGARQLVSWPLLQAQFGADYARLRKFREVFLTALRQVAHVYPAARLEAEDEGLLLYPSPPPITKARLTVPALPGKS